jgi:hypothetical protein
MALSTGAAQQLIQPEPMKLDFHSQELKAWYNTSGPVNSGVRPLLFGSL